MRDKIFKLRARMLKIGVKQKQLAKVFDIPQSTMSMRLNGHRNMPQGLLDKISRYITSLGV